MTSRPAPTGDTKVAGVIGDPVRHSLSPALFNAAFEACALDWTYVAFPVDAASGIGLAAAMRTFGIRGLSVTMPHKAAAAEVADQRSATAETLGVANCLVLDDDGQITAHNTDGDGFVKALAAETGLTPAGRSVLVFGAGGAARSVIYACERAGAAEIVVVNRSERKGRDAVDLGGSSARLGTSDDVSGAEIVVNATPLGMGDGDGFPCRPEILVEGQTVVDLIYSPWETPWLAAARKLGIGAVNGFPMLLHQAGAQFVIWTGREAPIAEMEAGASRQVNRA